ncbi:MAG: hypothetical protein ACPLKQ_05425 [Candidatus Bathyarchaeales archaeon]
MKKTLVKFAAILIILFLLGVKGVSAQSVTPGVSQGDSFAYNFSVFWGSSNPNATVPADLLQQNETEVIRVVVTDVGGSVVFMNITWQFKNGTTHSSQAFVNLQDGSGDGFGLVIAPNLGPKYYAYPKGWNLSTSFVINETLTKTYSFGVREVVHAVINRTSASGYIYVYYDMYFDRETGVMLEWYVEQVPSSSPTDKISSLWKIKEFNVKSATFPSNYTSEQSWQGILVLIILVCVVAVISILVHKRKSHRRARQH